VRGAGFCGGGGEEVGGGGVEGGVADREVDARERGLVCLKISVQGSPVRALWNAEQYNDGKMGKGIENKDSLRDLLQESSPLKPESIQRNQWTIWCCLQRSYPRFQII
jgi:hypothetical protein